MWKLKDFERKKRASGPGKSRRDSTSFRWPIPRSFRWNFSRDFLPLFDSDFRPLGALLGRLAPCPRTCHPPHQPERSQRSPRSTKRHRRSPSRGPRIEPQNYPNEELPPTPSSHHPRAKLSAQAPRVQTWMGGGSSTSLRRGKPDKENCSILISWNPGDCVAAKPFPRMV